MLRIPMSMQIELTKKNKYKIWYFVFLIFVLPTINCSGLVSVISRFIPNPLGYNLLTFFLSLPLLCKIKRKNHGLNIVVFSLGILISYLVFTFIRTVNATSFYLALTVFRHSFMQALNLFILLPFMLNLNKSEVNYGLKCIFRCLLCFTLLYLSNNLIYDWMGVKGGLMESHGGVSVDRSIIGLPLFDPFWTALLITYTLLHIPNAKKYLLMILLTLLISFTRNLLFSSFIVIFVVLFLAILRNGIYFGRSLKLIFSIISCVLLVWVIMPDSIDFWIAKLANTFGEDLKDNVGTFAFRERLIEDALFAIRFDPIFGLGYIRDVPKGEYSMVMGGDTYIAPILWCEGWLGLILRVIPFVSLTLLCLNKQTKINWVMWIVLACIVASGVNYVQTKILTDYPLILGLLVLLKIKDNYDRETKDFGNYSIL